MKKILFIGEVLIIFAMLLGCSNQEDVDHSIIKNNLVIDQISYIEIEIDTYKKAITNKENLDSLISFIKDIQILGNRLENVKETEANDIVRLKIYNKLGSVIESISIGEEATYYNNKWYPLDIQTYNRIRSFYKNVDSEELRDPLLLDTKQIRLNRKVKTTSEALQGLWLHENGSEIKFDKDYLYQGNQYEYIFEYNIGKTHDDNLDISINGIQGFYVKGKELSNLHIKMDATKTHMLMEKTMTGGMKSHDNYVFVDKDGLILGSFDSYFFYQNSWH